jgi:mono/diheme cytochrome c family protein
MLSASEPARATEPIGPPQSDYLLHCSGCHGHDGAGVPGVTPSLHGLGPVLAAPGGRSYLAGIPGVAQAPVDDATLATLLNFVLRHFSGVEADYSAAEIGRLRAQPIRDTVAARAALGIR